MKIKGTVFLHGYGVRGDIWNLFGSAGRALFGPTTAPDLDASDLPHLISLSSDAIRKFSAEHNGPVLVVGHSLGAVLTAIAANELDPGIVAGAVMLAPPYGNRESTPGALLKFLLKHHLIPPSLIRPRFFSDKTPLADQKRIFANAVPEAQAIQNLSFEMTWFHVPLLTGPLQVPSLVIASEADRIVSADQSVRMGERLGSNLVVLPRDDNVGHDDLFAAPGVVESIIELISRFVDGKP